MDTRRVSTQPTWPACVRMRLQPSVFTGGVSGAVAASSASSAWRESSTQSAGGSGGFGGGGSGTLLLRFSFGGALVFFGAGGINGVRGASVRGNRTDCSTANWSFSLSCTKLGDVI